jgi:subtilisin family serine protease
MADETITNALDRLSAEEDIIFAEPNIKWYPIPTTLVKPVSSTDDGVDIEGEGEAITATTATAIIPTPNDPLYASSQWNLANIKAPGAWSLASSTGNPTTKICIIDTGISPSHPDLTSNIDPLFPGRNPSASSDDPTDDDYISHGTHCSGIIGAYGNNGIGITGINWRVQLLGCKFIINGSGDTYQAIACLDYCMRQGATISSNSWGSTYYSKALRNAINQANTQGHLFIAAAGNNGADSDVAPFYPAAFDLPNVLSVAAIQQGDTLASFSNYGQIAIDMAAPGAVITSTFRDKTGMYLGKGVGSYGYYSFSGTSMACPHVAGAAAFLRGLAPSNVPNSEIKKILLSTARKIPSLTGKVATGGTLDMEAATKALKTLIEGGSLPPAPPPPPPVDVAALYSTITIPSLPMASNTYLLKDGLADANLADALMVGSPTTCTLPDMSRYRLRREQKLFFRLNIGSGGVIPPITIDTCNVSKFNTHMIVLICDPAALPGFNNCKCYQNDNSCMYGSSITIPTATPANSQIYAVITASYYWDQLWADQIAVASTTIRVRSALPVPPVLISATTAATSPVQIKPFTLQQQSVEGSTTSNSTIIVPGTRQIIDQGSFTSKATTVTLDYRAVYNCVFSGGVNVWYQFDNVYNGAWSVHPYWEPGRRKVAYKLEIKEESSTNSLLVPGSQLIVDTCSGGETFDSVLAIMKCTSTDLSTGQVDFSKCECKMNDDGCDNKSGSNWGSRVVVDDFDGDASAYYALMYEWNDVGLGGFEMGMTVVVPPSPPPPPFPPPKPPSPPPPKPPSPPPPKPPSPPPPKPPSPPPPKPPSPPPPKPPPPPPPSPPPPSPPPPKPSSPPPPRPPSPPPPRPPPPSLFQGDPGCGNTPLKGKPAWQSSTFKRRKATNAVDGVCSTNASRSSSNCAVTNPKLSYPWWSASLIPSSTTTTSNPVKVKTVAITLRSDAKGHKAMTGAVIYIGTGIWTGISSRTRGGFVECGKMPSKGLKAGQRVVVECGGGDGVVGSSVVVYLPKKKTSLGVCQVDVLMEEKMARKRKRPLKK